VRTTTPITRPSVGWMIASRISPNFAPVSTASKDIPRKSLATFNALTSITLLASAIAPPAENQLRRIEEREDLSRSFFVFFVSSWLIFTLFSTSLTAT
jgi:hypothetical protein